MQYNRQYRLQRFVNIIASLFPLTNTAHSADLTAPVISLLGSATMTLEAMQSTYQEPGYTAIDSYDGVITYKVSVSLQPNVSAVGNYTMAYTVSDAAGNMAIPKTRTITVRDTTAPTITLNGGSALSWPYLTTYTDPGATAIDLVDGNVTSHIIVQNLAALNVANQIVNQVATLTYSVTDNAGNTATLTRQVHVVNNNVPIITLLGQSSVVLQGNQVDQNFADPGATATDFVDGNLTPFITTVSTPGSVNISSLGTYTIVYSVHSFDGTRQAVPVTRTVTVIDTKPPAMTLNGNASVYVQGATPYVDDGVTITDNLDSSPVLQTRLQITGLSLVNTSRPAGTGFLISYSVSDTSGNAAVSLQRTVTIIDSIPPVIVMNGSPYVTVEAATAYSDAGATSTDTLDGTDPVISSSSVNLYPPNTPINFTVTYSAHDNAGNNATALTRTVHVVDTTPPIITVVGNLSVTVEAATFYADAGASAADTLDGTDPVVTYNPINLRPLATPVTYSIIYAANDKAGNVAVNKTRNVTVVDTTPPTITLLGNASMTLQENFIFSDPSATSTDSLNGDLTHNITVAYYRLSVATVNSMLPANHSRYTVPAWSKINALNISLFAVSGVSSVVTAGSLYIIVYSVADKAGNKASTNRTVMIVDIIPPVVTLTVPISTTIQGQVPCLTTYNQIGATAYDSVDGNLTSTLAYVVQSSNGTSGLLALIDCASALQTVWTISYSVSDASGNSAAPVSRTVTLIDTISPVIFLLGLTHVTLYAGENYTEFGATAFDSYAGNLTSGIVVSGSSDIVATEQTVNLTFTVVYSCKDTAGNTGIAYRYVYIESSAAPTASSAMPVGPVVGGAVGGTLVLIVLLVLILARSRKNRHVKAAPEPGLQFSNPLYTTVDQWFHGSITREESEQRITATGKGDGTVLIRTRGSSGKDFVISFTNSDKFYHYLLNQQDDGQFKIQTTLCDGWGTNVDSIVRRLQGSHEGILPVALKRAVLPPIGTLGGRSEVTMTQNPLYAETSAARQGSNGKHAVIDNPVYETAPLPSGKTGVFSIVLTDPKALPSNQVLYTRRTTNVGGYTFEVIARSGIAAGVPLYIKREEVDFARSSSSAAALLSRDDSEANYLQVTGEGESKRSDENYLDIAAPVSNSGEYMSVGGSASNKRPSLSSKASKNSQNADENYIDLGAGKEYADVGPVDGSKSQPADEHYLAVSPSKTPVIPPAAAKASEKSVAAEPQPTLSGAKKPDENEEGYLTIDVEGGKSAQPRASAAEEEQEEFGF